MSDEASESENAVVVLVDEFLGRHRRGERPSVTEFAEQHPEHAEQIRSLVPAMLLMEEFGPNSDADAQSARSALLARMPQRLGDYTLIRPIGSGGMGVVYEAIQESLGRHVALKTISSRMPDDATRLERFRREALAAARLQHAHIVPVFGIGEHDGLYFYTMQFIHGYGLDVILRDVDSQQRALVASNCISEIPAGKNLAYSLAWNLCQGRFLPQFSPGVRSVPESRTRIIATRNGTGERFENTAPYFYSVAWLGVQVAEALEYAHRQGVLHRDIKPSNLLLDDQGHVWVTDFGLAKTQDDDELTRTGDVVGTLRYMAPERFSGWSDPRSDIFALGATLYELSTFRPAFDEPDRVRLVDRLLHGSPLPLRQHNRQLPRDLETVILKALANSPTERYVTAGHFAEDLRRVVAGRPVIARRFNAIERTWSWCRRNRAVACAMVIVALALMTTVVMSMVHAHSQSRAASDFQELADDLAKQRQSLRASLIESRRILAMRDFDRAQAAFEKNQAGPGLLWMLASWRSAIEAGDLAWQRLALANVSAWSAIFPRLLGLLSHDGPIGTAVFSPDGTTILTGSDDLTAQLWDAATARPIGQPLRHPGAVHAVALSPHGKIALTGCADGAARLWDVTTGRLIRSPLRHAGGVFAVAFSPDGETILTGGADHVARLWHTTTGLPIGEPLRAQRPVTAVAFNPDGDVVVTTSRDATAQLWSATNGKPIGPSLQHRQEVLAAAFSPDGKTLLTGTWDGTLYAWDTLTGQAIRTEIQVHRSQIRGIAFRPDGRTYVTAGEDKSARFWNATTHQPIGTLLIHQGPVVAVAFCPDGQALLTASSDHTTRVWDAESCRYPQPVLRNRGAGLAVAFRPDGRSFLTADGVGTARLWDVATGFQIAQEMQSYVGNRSVAFSPDGKVALIGGSPAQLWDTSTTQPISRALAHPGCADVVAFHPGGKMVATGGADHTTRLWDAAMAQPIGSPISHPGTVDALTFSPDGAVMVTGLDAGIAQIWDAHTWKPIGKVLRHPGAVSAVAVSPDSNTIATGCEDGMARLWNARTGELRVPPLPHQAWVFAVAFSPGGEMVLTGSRDRLARLWDTSTGQPIGPPFPHLGQLWSVAFAPDSKSILTGDTSGTAQIFAIAPTLHNKFEQISTWIEVLTGLRLDATQGSIVTLDNAIWRAQQDLLKRKGGWPTDQANAWIRDPGSLSDYQSR